jgi:hypothetical protein
VPEDEVLDEDLQGEDEETPNPEKRGLGNIKTSIPSLPSFHLHPRIPRDDCLRRTDST